MKSAKIVLMYGMVCVLLCACKREEVFIYTVNVSTYDPGIGVLNKISFANSDMGFISTANGKVLKTTNQGATWSAVTVGTANLNLQWLSTPAAQALYVSGKESSNGKFYRSLDSGDTWIMMPGNFNFELIDFPSANRGYMISAGSLYKTNNGGSLWNYTNGLGTVDPQVLAFSSNDTGMVVGFDNDAYITTNGGAITTQVYGLGFGNGKKTVDIKFISSLQGYAIDYQGGILATHNAGNTWTGLRLSTETVGEDYETYAVDAYGSTICAVGDRALLISKDGGSTFNNYYDQQGISIPDVFVDVAVVSAAKIIAIGTSGKIYTITF